MLSLTWALKRFALHLTNLKDTGMEGMAPTTVGDRNVVVFLLGRVADSRERD